ncbi:MAG: hypothetical protein ACLTT1_01720 [[Clostridium] scindens]
MDETGANGGKDRRREAMALAATIGRMECAQVRVIPYRTVRITGISMDAGEFVRASAHGNKATAGTPF